MLLLRLARTFNMVGVQKKGFVSEGWDSIPPMPRLCGADLIRHFTTQEESPTEPVDFGFQSVPRREKAGRVAEVFNSVANSYDVMNDLMSAGLHRLWKDRLVQKLRPFPGMQHLDVAGGTGDVAFRIVDALALAQAGQAGKGLVTVCDINPSMLAEGQKRALKFYPGADMAWIVGDAETLPLPDSSMDSYTIAFGIRNVTNKAAALKDAHRVLRKGGRLLVLEFSHVTIPELQQVYDAYSFQIIPALGHFVANDRSSYQYLVESIRQFPDQEEFKAMIGAAGFKAVDYENMTGGVVAIHSAWKL
mmetsp:Transcript_15667/g.43833  ORF Transcript_15667/g.43833 Transcript_15667/m.43833 type:complete len:304 (-) Transcript_15667:258-1169(-)